MNNIKLSGRPKCPACQELCDGASSATDDVAVPKPGDGTICAYCQTLLEFDDDMSLQLMTEEAKHEIGEETLEMMRASCEAMAKRFPRATRH